MDNNHFIIVLLVAAFAAPSQGDCPRDVDPCDSDVYVELDEPTRSTGYFVQGSTSDSDYSLATKWYRSVSGAGGDMPTSPVNTSQCDAYAPVWLNGTLPTGSEGIKNITACASFVQNSCIRQYTVAVKNCGDFNVYCLSHTSDDFDRYCMGSEVECPTGQTSLTGFTPGCSGPSSSSPQPESSPSSSGTLSSSTTSSTQSTSNRTPSTPEPMSSTTERTPSTTDRTSSTTSTSSTTDRTSSTTDRASSTTDRTPPAGDRTPPAGDRTSSELTPQTGSTASGSAGSSTTVAGPSEPKQKEDNLIVVIVVAVVIVVLVILVAGIVVAVVVIRNSKKKDKSKKSAMFDNLQNAAVEHNAQFNQAFDPVLQTGDRHSDLYDFIDDKNQPNPMGDYDTIDVKGISAVSSRPSVPNLYTARFPANQMTANGMNPTNHQYESQLLHHPQIRADERGTYTADNQYQTLYQSVEDKDRYQKIGFANYS